VPLSFDGPQGTEIAVGDLLVGQRSSGTLPRFGEASVGVGFVWDGHRREECFGYLEGSMAHVEFVVADGGRVTCSHDAFRGVVLGWLNTL